MLCSRFLRPARPGGAGQPLLYRILEWFFDGTRHAYSVSLGWVLRHRPVMLAVFTAVLGATVYLYIRVPKGFIPEADNDQIYVNTESSQGTSPYQMARYQQRGRNPDEDPIWKAS
jgi:HAE1 family hydrophobic/amphiphilic exporter-1